MTDPASIAFYRICELSNGKNAGFAGFVGYKAIAASGIQLEHEIRNLIAQPADISKQPRRRVAGTSDLDPPLTVIAEQGVIKYVFILDPDTNSSFDVTDPIFAIPIAGKFAANFITQIMPIEIDGKFIAASFILDCSEVGKSGLASAVVKCREHNGAVRIPICFNIIDDRFGFPQSAIDDHRYSLPGAAQIVTDDDDHDHDHSHGDEQGRHFHKISNHGGAHPPTSSNAALAIADAGHRTHGGAHPLGVSSYVVVELP